MSVEAQPRYRKATVVGGGVMGVSWTALFLRRAAASWLQSTSGLVAGSRWEAARHMLDHDTYYGGEPLLRAPALGLLVGISDALSDFFSGRPADPQRGIARAQELRDMVEHLGRIVDETTQEYTP